MIAYMGICLCTFRSRLTFPLRPTRCTSLHCSTGKCASTKCSTVLYSSVQFSAVQYSSVQFSAVQCSSVQFITVQYSLVQFSAVQCTVLPYALMKYSRVQAVRAFWLIILPILKVGSGQALRWTMHCELVLGLCLFKIIDCALSFSVFYKLWILHCWLAFTNISLSTA